MADPAQCAAAVRRVRAPALRALRDARRRDHGATSRPSACRGRSVPLYLAFMGDCDGPAREQLAELAQRAGDGPAPHLLALRGLRSARRPARLAHRARPCPSAARYVNWIGRTVQQIREESALQRALSARVPRGPADAAVDPQALRRELLAFVAAPSMAAGRLALTPPSADAARLADRATCFMPSACRLLGLIAAAAADRAAARLHPAAAPAREARPGDLPAARARTPCARCRQLEDHDLSNSFTALGPVKPGLFRRWLVQRAAGADRLRLPPRLRRAATWRACRPSTSRAGSSSTTRPRVLFASNYDGSHESYMDDFINKVAWGLNLIFSNGFGWPRTDWLIKGGARHELRFKYYQRRPPAADAGLVQGLPRPHAGRPGAQPAHPRRLRAACA